MKVFALFLLLILGFIILAYYLYLVLIGKSLARLVGSKDRFIWNGLKNVTDRASRGRVTVFLDRTHLMVSTLGLPATYSSLREGSLDQGTAIAYEDIVHFDYDSRNVIPLISPIINYIFKVNDYILKLSYYDEDAILRKMKFRASGMDPLDFEISFAEFNNKIYGSRGLRTGNQDLDPSSPAQSITSPKDNTDKTLLIPKATKAQENPSRTLEDKTELLDRSQFSQTNQAEESKIKNKVSEEDELTRRIIFKEEELEGLEADLADPQEEKTGLFKKSLFKDRLKTEKSSESQLAIEKDQPINRRSFLDNNKKTEAKEATVKVELPEELKKVDLTGLSPEEISAKELERLNKLKEFFSEKVDD